MGGGGGYRVVGCSVVKELKYTDILLDVVCSHCIPQ
jgi:hypothetical protein